MDRIIISGLKLETVIGTLDWERKLRQTVILDLEIDMDAKPAAVSDRLSDTLDYSVIAQRLFELVSGSEFRLIEALAETCARVVLTEFQVAQVRLTLHKPGAVPSATDIALCIERCAADYA